MKIKFLGTSGAEGFPALACSCSYCKKAKRLKGKNIRTRSQTIIDSRLLIDFGPDTLAHFHQYNINFNKINNILITHHHEDHLCVSELLYTNNIFKNKKDNHIVNVYLSQTSFDHIEKYIYLRFEKSPSEFYQNIKFHIIKAFDEIDIDGYKITPLMANHMAIKDEAFVYLIRKNEQTFLYFCDSGTVLPETYDYLKNNNIQIDSIIFDCAKGKSDDSYKGHMNIDDVVKMSDAFISDKILKDKKKLYLTHISHKGKLNHEEFVKAVKKYSLKVAFDGLTYIL